MYTIAKPYQNSSIHFSWQDADVMVNATEMARPFAKRPVNYLDLPTTKERIEALTKVRFSDFGSEPLPPDFLVRTQRGGNKSGTWIHQIIAVEFAGWLSVDFKIWMYQTIIDILTSPTRAFITNVRQKAEADRQLAEMETKMVASGNQDGIAYLELKKRRQALFNDARRNYKEIKNQLTLPF